MATNESATIGVFDTHEQAETAVRELLKGGFPKERISIVAKGLQKSEDVQGFVNTGDIAKGGAGIGAWTGGIFGLLIGTAFLWVPGFGPLIVAGPLTAALLGGVEGAAAGAAGGGILGALFSPLVTKKHVLKYQEHLNADHYLVVAHGAVADAEKAREILGQADSIDVDVFSETEDVEAN